MRLRVRRAVSVAGWRLGAVSVAWQACVGRRVGNAVGYEVPTEVLVKRKDVELIKYFIFR
jgi:hypothetical protein